MRWRLTTGLAFLSLLSAGATHAGVTAEEAQALKGRLTPVGAERAGNADGTIPAWTGGDARNAVSFAAEKPLFTITSANYSKYADRLPEGAIALFQRDRDYRMTIYATHRSAAAPQSVYDSIFLNATRAHAAPEGIAYGVENAAGGIPFPIPKNGFEAVWNHLLAFWGPAREVHLKTYTVTADGAPTLATSYREIADFPFYYPGGGPRSYGGYYFKTLHLDDGPPAKAGEGYLNWQPIDTARYPFAAWRALPGEHRVRRGPSLSYDIPDADASGFQNLDEYYVFFGGPDRYDFRLVGKKEMYVPYNNNPLYAHPASEVLGPRHGNPDLLRYELHRVWVVEGTLAPGKHHVAPHRKLYLDEDTWFALYGVSWDEQGRLWKFSEGTTYLLPDLPALILGSVFTYDFELGGYAYSFAFDAGGYKVTPPHPASLFSPAGLAAQGVR